MSVMETPRFDAYDDVYGRSRIETKIDNLLYGRDAVTKQVWQVARLTLYQGNDTWNEIRKAEDYEIEMDLRPRPWWGLQMVAERHIASDELADDAPYGNALRWLEFAEDVVGRPVDPDLLYRFNAQYGSFDRVLGYVYYDDTVFSGGRFNGRIGFAYTKTRNQVYNREILYGMGYRLSDEWSVAFEHRYDFERNDLYRQQYEVRRKWRCWETALTFRERRQGWDIGFEMSLAAFPGTRLKF